MEEKLEERLSVEGIVNLKIREDDLLIKINHIIKKCEELLS